MILRGHKDTSDELQGTLSSKERSERPRVFAGSADLLFGLLSIFQMSQFEEVYLKQLLEE